MISLLLLALAQTDAKGLRWPLGDGTQPYPLRATYGQIEPGPQFHYGVDILPRVMGAELEPVYAVEAGKVVRMRTSSVENKAVVVRSDAHPERAFLYLHLGKISVAVDDPVVPGDQIGTIAATHVGTGEPHLHLSRLAGNFETHAWKDLSTLSVENPLLLLKKPAGNDGAPRFGRYPGGSVFKLVADDGLEIRSVEESPDTVAVEGVYSSKLQDVVVRAFDVDAQSWHLLAPYKLSLEILAPGQATTFRTIVLGGELDEEDNSGLYCLKPGSKSKGNTKARDYDYFFTLTNSGSPGSSENAWPMTTGQYTFRARVEDAYGNAHTVEEAVNVP